MASGVYCCVVNCTNARHNLKGQKRNESLRFFVIPKVKTREGEHVRAVTERRRRAWVAAIRRTDITFEHSSYSLRVCCRHFHRGQPAYEMAETDPDWAPSLHLGHEESIAMEGNGQVECKVETIKQIVVTEDDVVDLWHTVGASRGLTTDVDVCRFLLSLYFSDGQDETDGARCGQCNSLLTLVCAKCQRPSQGPLQQGMSSQIHTQQGTHSEICSLQSLPSQQLSGKVFLPASSGNKELFSQQQPSVQSSSQQVSPLPSSSQLAPWVQPSLQQAVQSEISSQENISSNAPILTSQLPSNSKEVSLTQTLSESEGDQDLDGGLDMQVFDSEDSDVEMAFEQAKNVQKSEKRGEKDLASATSQPKVQSKSLSEKNRLPKTAIVMLHKCDMPLSTKQSDPSGVRSSSGKGRQTSGVKRRGIVQGLIQTAEKLSTVSSQRCPKQQDSSVDTHRESPDTHRGSTTEQDGTSQPAKAEQILVLNVSRFGPRLEPVEEKARPVQRCSVPSCPFETDRSYDMKRHMTKHDKYGPQWLSTQKTARPQQHCIVPACSFATSRSYDMKKHMGKHVAEAIKPRVVVVPIKPGPKPAKGSSAGEKVQRLCCSVPNCPYATNWTRDMKFHMKKHDRLGPQLKLVEKKARPIQQCKVSACRFKTDRNFDMKKHMTLHDKHGPLWRSGRKQIGPLQHCSVPACSFSTTKFTDMQRHKERHDEEAVSVNISKKPDPVDSPAPRNVDAGHSSAPEDPDASCLSATGNLDTSNPCASGNLDSSAPEKPDASLSSDHVKSVRNELSVEGNLDRSFSNEHINLDPVDFSAHEKPDPSDFSAFLDLDPSDLSGQVIFDLSEFGVEVKPDPSDSSAQEKPGPSAQETHDSSNTTSQQKHDSSNTSNLEKPESSNTSSLEKPESSNISSLEKTESSNTSSLEKPESSNTSSLEKPESSNTSSLEKPESSNTSSLEKPESSNTSSLEKPESRDKSSQEKHDSSNTSSLEKSDPSESKAQEKCHASDPRTKNKVKRYRCSVPLCTYATYRVHDIRRHMRRNKKHGAQVEKPVHQCKEPNCRYTTTRANDMKKHVERHANRSRMDRCPKPFWIPHVERSYRKGVRELYCRVGDCTYTTFTSHASNIMLKHMRSKHPSVAGKIKIPLSTKKRLGQTTISHLCEQCGMAYTSESGLRGHKEKVHMGYFRYRCDKCDTSFFLKARFSYHMLQHEDVTCKECGETLPGKKELQLHMKTTHPPHTCLDCEQEGCQATFSAKLDLTRHMEQTHKKKPERLACEEEGCQATFSLKSDLTRHIRSKHKGRNFVCPVCGLTLSYTFTLTRHMRKCHNMTVNPQIFWDKKKAVTLQRY